MAGRRKRASRISCALLALAALSFCAACGLPEKSELSALFAHFTAPQAETVAESAAILPAVSPREEQTEPESAPPDAHPAAQEQDEPVLPAIAPQGMQDAAPLPDYAPEITNHTAYRVDPAAFSDADIPALAFDGTPEILIVHTHSSESFMPDDENPYLPTDGMRTLDTKYNVVRLGDEIAKALEEAGIGVVHDREINDYPSYNGAYSQMRKRIEGYIRENPTIRIVLDIHRDAILDEKGNHLALRTELSGEDTARVMFVVGTDEGGLSHPSWRKNLSFACALQRRGDALYPGLMRPVDLRRERFNQHATAGSLIVEIGSSGNTLTEARRGAACFVKLLLETLAQEK